MADKNTTAAAKFQFVGAGSSGKGEKIDWPVAVQGAIIKSYLGGGKTAKVVFAEGLIVLNAAREEKGLPAITELPKSYTNNNAGSLLHGMRARFIQRCEKGDKETMEVATALQLIEPKSTTPATE